jgi:DNA-directed RNA polymerase specialized sigma24 family protein
MTYEEIAASLDMPIGSIGPTRARALERLRHELELGGELSLIDE